MTNVVDLQSVKDERKHGKAVVELSRKINESLAGHAEEAKMQSESIGNLAEALSAAQGEIKAPKKGRIGKIQGESKRSGKEYEYEYSYADLADVIECYRAPLSRQALAVTQYMEIHADTLVLVTKLMHKSGEWMTSEYPLPIYARAQEQGSAITYARRYAVTALLGIAAEDDDDGKSAQDAEPAKRAQTAPARTGQSGPSGDRPDCPKCLAPQAVIASKFKEGEFVCYDKKGGCGLKFKPQDVAKPTPGGAPADDPFGDTFTEEVPFGVVGLLPYLLLALPFLGRIVA